MGLTNATPGSIKPIETYYNGYRFRSRLEARWAVFFDAIGLEYQYEPEGYTGLDDIPYLPDFFFPKFNLYAEVKGTDESLRRDGEKIAAAIDFEATPVSNGLLVLGDIPNPTQFGWGNIPMFHCLQWKKGVFDTCAIFYKPTKSEAKIVIGEKEILSTVFTYRDWWRGKYYSDFYADGQIPETTSTKNSWTHGDLLAVNSKDLEAAYIKARQARFEHGETPII